MFWKSTCVRKNIPKFLLCTLNLRFWNPWLNFISGQKKTHTVLNRPQNVKLTFIIFFSKCCTGHLKCAFGNPEENISQEIPSFCSKTENFHTINLAKKKFWTCSSGHVGYGFENLALLFCWKSMFFLLNTKNVQRKQISEVNFPIFFSLHNDRWFGTPD